MTDIRNIDGDVIYTSANETDTIKEAIEQAAAAGVSLQRADLRGADLRGIKLKGADLRDSDLRDSDLRDADFIGGIVIDNKVMIKILHGANLQGALLTDEWQVWRIDLWGGNINGAKIALKTKKIYILTEVNDD